MAEPTGGAERQVAGMRALRWLARILIRGEAAPVLLTELEDLLESDLGRGLSAGRARRRYLANTIASSWALIRAHSLPSGGISLLDIRLGARMLWKLPGLTAAAVFALAIGIPVGLAPWHFTGIAEADLPVPEGDRIRALRYWSLQRDQAMQSTVRFFVPLQANLSRVEEIGAVRVGRYNVGAAEGGSALVEGAEVTESTFGLLRVPALLGRTLSSDDFRPEAPPVAVLGESIWRSRFNADPAVIGKEVWIGGMPHSVVGVMPTGFKFPRTQDLWIPLKLTTGDDAALDRHVAIFGRLAPGASDESAWAEFSVFLSSMLESEPEHYQDLEAQVTPFSLAYSPGRKGRIAQEPDFYLLLLSALAVLAVACANVGMLIFARTSERGRELAVRTALGASRRRVVTQIVVETGVIAVIAVGAGLILLDRVPPLLLSMPAPGLTSSAGPISEMMPWWHDYGISWPTVAWGLVLAAVSAILAGIVPALRMTSAGVQRNIQRAEAGRSGARFGGVPGVLIAADVAIVVAVLGFASATVGAMVRADLAQDDMAIDAGEFLSAQIALSTAQPSTAAERDSATTAVRRAQLHQQFIARLGDEPGVLGVGAADALPRYYHRRGDVELDAGPSTGGEPHYDVRAARVYPGYFAGLGVEPVMGRTFNVGDLEGEVSVVIINTDMAQFAFGGANPIGRRIRYLRNDSEPGPWLEVVGVVPRLGMRGLGIEDDYGGLYHPMPAGSVQPLRVAIRTGGDPLQFVPRLRTILNETDPELGLLSAVPLSQVREEDWYLLGILTMAGATLMVVLIALAVSGLYAITSFAVSQRTREIGIRTALGAGDASIALTVARRSLIQVGVGTLLGMPIAWKIFTSIAVGGRTAVAAALLPGIGVMILISLLACTGPTLRALRIEPTEALRN